MEEEVNYLSYFSLKNCKLVEAQQALVMIESLSQLENVAILRFITKARLWACCQYFPHQI